MVSKQIQPYWYLQQLVDAEVRRLAPDAAVTPVVMYDDEKIQRHEDCPGVGRVRWYVRYVLPAADSSGRALKPILDAAMVRPSSSRSGWSATSMTRSAATTDQAIGSAASSPA